MPAGLSDHALPPSTVPRAGEINHASQHPVFSNRSPDVSAPSEAWRFLPGESPGRVRANHPPVSSVAPLTDSVANGKDTVANVNNRGEAYTENLVGQRGDAPP